MSSQEEQRAFAHGQELHLAATEAGPQSTVTTATRAGSLSASGSVAGPVVSAPVLRRAAVDPAGGGSRRIFSPSVAHGANGCPNPARISLTRRCVVAASTASVD